MTNILGNPLDPTNGATLTGYTGTLTAANAGFNIESDNYTFTDNYLTRIFSTVK